jgi:hypothetical protein
VLAAHDAVDILLADVQFLNQLPVENAHRTGLPQTRRAVFPSFQQDLDHAIMACVPACLPCRCLRTSQYLSQQMVRFAPSPARLSVGYD